MSNWDALSDLDVEVLVRDLLSAEWQHHVESFRRGPDQGIDLRATGPSGPPLNLKPGERIVVQVKHYPNATLSRLIRAFSVEAERKINRSGVRYVPVTTARLSPRAKDRIGGVFSPKIDSSSVLGREDLEAMLVRHPAIERRHIRLWLTDTRTLESVVHARERWLQSQVTRDIREQASLLVPTRHSRIARDLLDSEGAVILAGPPGAGKTSAALLLLAEQVHEGWEVLAAVDSLSEVESIRDDDVKQIIYYDDFLGSSLRTAFLSGKNEDRKIVSLLAQCKENPRLQMVLTTREYILAAARRIHPRLSEDQVDITRVILDASDLDVFERAEILYRHIYFSKLRSILSDPSNTSQLWVPVLVHRAFNPRLVRLYVQAVVRTSLDKNVPSVVRFSSELVRTFENPEDLWRNIFEDHLSYSQRKILNMCATMPSFVVLTDLLIMLSGSGQDCGDAELDAQRRADLRTLDGDFLSISTATIVGITDSFISFANTSIASYAITQLAVDTAEFVDILGKIILFEQLEQLWRLFMFRCGYLNSYAGDGDGLDATTYAIEQEEEIFSPLQTVTISQHDLRLFRVAFKNALLRTYRTGRYDGHPSLGLTPRRWRLRRAPIAYRVQIVYGICEALGLDGDEELMNSMLDPFIEYISEGRGDAESVLDGITCVFEGGLPSWLSRKEDLIPPATRYFLRSLVDGKDFLLAISYLQLIGDKQRLARLEPQLVHAIESFASTDAAVFRMDDLDSREIDIIINEFSEAAELIDAEVVSQLAYLRNQLSDLLSSRSTSRERVGPFSESPPLEPQRPARASSGDVSPRSARIASTLLCPSSGTIGLDSEEGAPE